MSLPEIQHHLEKARVWCLALPFIVIALASVGLMVFFGIETSIDRVSNNQVPIEIPIILAIAFAILFAVTFSYYTDSASKKLMPFVLDNISDRIGKDYRYTNDSSYNTSAIGGSGLVNLADEHEIGSMVDSTAPDGLKLTMFNLTTYDVTRDKDGKRQRSIVDSGVFVSKKANRDSGVKIIVRDKTFFASKSMSIHGEELPVVQSINKMFEKDYRVYSNDPVKALRFLSPSMIEKFMNLARQNGHVCEISVSNDTMYLFLNNATIKAVSWSPIRKPDVHGMIDDAMDNMNQILDMIDLVCNEERLARMDG